MIMLAFAPVTSCVLLNIPNVISAILVHCYSDIIIKCIKHTHRIVFGKAINIVRVCVLYVTFATLKSLRFR